MRVKFKEWDCNIEKLQYDNGRVALNLIDKDGDLIATATVNLPDVPLAENETLIKDWGENEGILDALIAAGIVSESIEMAPTGFVFADKCKLLI